MKSLFILIALAFTSLSRAATTKIPVTMIQEGTTLIKAPGLAKPKTCLYGFGGASATLAAPTECSTGTCVEVFDSCGTVSPPTFSAAGVYLNLTFASGTWANSSIVKCDCIGYATTSGQSRFCTPYFTTAKNSWASNASGGMVFDVTVSVGSNMYALIECTGQAP